MSQDLDQLLNKIKKFEYYDLKQIQEIANANSNLTHKLINIITLIVFLGMVSLITSICVFGFLEIKPSAAISILFFQCIIWAGLTYYAYHRTLQKNYRITLHTPYWHINNDDMQPAPSAELTQLKALCDRHPDIRHAFCSITKHRDQILKADLKALMVSEFLNAESLLEENIKSCELIASIKQQCC